MAASFVDINAGLKDTLLAIPGLRVVDYLPEQINPPTAIVMVDSVDYEGAFQGGLVSSTHTVMVFVSRTNNRGATIALDQFMSQGQVPEALKRDYTLDGLVASALVKSAQSFVNYAIGDAQYLGVTFTVEVKS